MNALHFPKKSLETVTGKSTKLEAFFTKNAVHAHFAANGRRGLR
jgi:hypothetical protein